MLIGRLSLDLTQRFGRGCSRQNIQNMRLFYLANPLEEIRQTLSGESRETLPGENRQTASGESEDRDPLRATSAESLLADAAPRFPLTWSAYIRLLAVKNMRARKFYEAEALRGGWTVRQLDPADQRSVLRTHSPLEEQDRHAGPQSQARARRRGLA